MASDTDPLFWSSQSSFNWDDCNTTEMPPVVSETYLLQANPCHSIGPLSMELFQEVELWSEKALSDISVDILQNKSLLSGNNISQTDPKLAVFQAVLQNLDYYFVPLIMLVGVVGNTLSFVVFVATHLKRNSCHIYLASLALADNMFLFCVFISWSDKIGISLYNQQGWCQVLVYLTTVGSFLSVWYVVAFTMERWLVTCHPLQRNRLCTTKVAKTVVISLALFALVAYSYTLFTSGVITFEKGTVCAPLPEYSHVVSTIDNIDTLITLIIPTFIIIGCNIKISYVVFSFYKTYRETPRREAVQKWDFSHSHGQRRNRPLESPWNCSNNNVQQIPISQFHKPLQNKPVSLNITRNSHMRATQMLLIVSTVFLVCNLPSHAARTYSFVMSMVDDSYYQPIKFILIQKLFQIIYYVNFAVNFFLYSLSGRSFRNGLKRLKTKIKKKWKSVTCKPMDGQSPNSSPRMMSSKTEQVPSYL